MAVDHLVDQVGALADQVMQQVGGGSAVAHGAPQAPANSRTAITANNTSINLFTSITNTFVNHK